MPDERARRILDRLELPEGFQSELINGAVIVSPPGKPLRWMIQSELLHQFLQQPSWHVAAGQTICHPDFSDEPQPDFFALPVDAPLDLEGRYPAEHLTLVTEVLSRSTKGIDLVDKVQLYARFGIPFYLIVDPFQKKCTLHCFVENGRYTDAVSFDFGRTIPLPEPFHFSLDSSGFPAYRSAADS
ncbi:Uma2 family endonuclease [Kitasatospora sp. LaBMicrA B282]|uniref:Uma2 family endonuclease n=1 Tax=Kitasatospora sp. LaBMicrA B282 TaxID=3420949 RepID=UPI003D0F5AC3